MLVLVLSQSKSYLVYSAPVVSNTVNAAVNTKQLNSSTTMPRRGTFILLILAIDFKERTDRHGGEYECNAR